MNNSHIFFLHWIMSFGMNKLMVQDESKTFNLSLSLSLICIFSACILRFVSVVRIVIKLSSNHIGQRKMLQFLCSSIIQHHLRTCQKIQGFVNSVHKFISLAYGQIKFIFLVYQTFIPLFCHIYILKNIYTHESSRIHCELIQTH